VPVDAYLQEFKFNGNERPHACGFCSHRWPGFRLQSQTSLAAVRRDSSGSAIMTAQKAAVLRVRVWSLI
jgi:hypothetical protein